jgi:acetolactate synthase I/III small subunit
MATTGGQNGDQIHTISAVVDDRAGVLARISGLFARRGFNIASLAVNRTHQPNRSRMTIRVEGGQSTVCEQIVKQLYKLVEVLKVYDHVDTDVIERELALVKVACNAGNRAEIMQIATIFRAAVVDVTDSSLVVEVTGRGEKIDALVRLLEPFGISEMARTGCVILARGVHET